MAKWENVNPLNVPGALFVDMTCIDCGTCYHLAKNIFKEQDDRSVVVEQPSSPREWVQAKEAMISCPTNSIGVKNAPVEFREARVQFPLLISGNVYYCGYTSRDSYGASSYFIQRADGNILIDSPRMSALLIEEIEKMGGIKTMILTHQDDVADHALYAETFGCERIIHQDDVNLSTQNVERKLDIKETLIFDHDIKIIPVPGHTKGHIAILYQDSYLFTGDHLFTAENPSRLTASRGVCWYSWTEQIKSTRKLLSENFEWVLPGHGGWGYFPFPTKNNLLEDLVREMERKV